MGLLLTVLGVNIFMISLAFNTSPGLVRDDFYETGKRYSDELLKPKAESPYLLKMNVPLLKQNLPATITVNLLDKASQQMVEGGKGVLFVYRPSDKNADFELPMTQTDNGLWRVDVTFSLPGLWDMIAEVQVGDATVNQPYRIQVVQ
ncbi:nitrogen fixation protein FixH [Pelagibaculum spongiae]|uniref:Nitrogen fixation protein FixH n=2 Tax=Pelagibaculum spongiae TaxID=2080658 RepID=A0A2V1GWW9_9GAMM|nr:nitrogen fixation protein FixH [Pelagibaculum spongiae]